MTSVDEINHWLEASAETEVLEFKEAKNQYDTSKLVRYCVAIANEGGGKIVLGISDKKPRRIVGTSAFSTVESINAIKSRILEQLSFRVDVEEVSHLDGRILVFHIPSRPKGQPIHIEGTYLMRSGEELVPMSPDQLRKIFSEGKTDWFQECAKIASADEIISLLDTQTFFELLNLPYPTSREGVLSKLSGEGLIISKAGYWQITNLAAILLAKKLDFFSPELARKAPRFIVYDGVNKTKTRVDQFGGKGYAVGFENLIEFVHSAAPLNKSVEQVIREEIKMFPKQALRELVANALIHQDFSISGASVMIEMFDDRVEISNPGKPQISVERFIDEYRSTNERFADFMRRLGICEEKGSGIDKVVSLSEVYQLPAPDFRVSEFRTIAILFAHQKFDTMSKSDRIRACYQHCCLMYVSNQRMSNQSLRKRFSVPESKVATVSLVIAAAKEQNLIKSDETETTSTRYARYLPFWA